MGHRKPWEWARGDPPKNDASLEFRDKDMDDDSETSESESSPRSKAKGDSVSTASAGNGRSGSPEGGDIRLLKTNSSGQGLWYQAWEEVRKEMAKSLPPEFQSVDTLKTMDQAQKVQDLAKERAEASMNHQRKIPHTNMTYRQVYGKVANCANKFQIVGDLVAQGEPVYAALPWALIRFGIQCVVGEDDAYHTMLSSAELVSDLASQYPALEQLYAKLDSAPSKKLRKSLMNFYKTILSFQVYAINYFDPHSKAKRTAIGMNPVTADGISHRRQEISDQKRLVDDDAAIVSYEVTKNGIDNLKTSQQGQDLQLQAIKQGILALAGNTGQAFKRLSKEQEDRNNVLIGMWKEPLENLMTELENKEIEKARANLHQVRKWVSVAKPRNDLIAAKEKRQMSLGEWLLSHPRYQGWQSQRQSSILWLYGFAGTGKTGLVCRVIDQLEKPSQRTNRTAYFFCSNDKAKSGSMEFFSRSDPEEALRSIVSQVATLQEGNYVAPVLQNKYNAFGPNSDQPASLTSSECIDILVAISEDVPITIVLDAFDEFDQNESPRLLRSLQNLIHRSPNVVNIFISTRPFPAIEDNLTPDKSIEIVAANNGSDVRTFIKSTLEDRIKNQELLNGDVPDDLKGEIETTLATRAGNMFLYASLLLNQLCNKNHNDDPASIRRKLESLPRDLADVYNRVMVDIHDEKNNSERSCLIAQNTIKWLLCAQEPLTCDALIEAVSPPEKRAKHEEIDRACRTLVVKGKDTYEFAHYSVREHVVQMEEYRSSRCHLVATQSCLSVLDTSFGNEKQQQSMTKAQKTFEHYALLYWPVHYEHIQEDDMRDQRTNINTMLRSLLLQGRSEKNKYQIWFEEVRKKERQLKENKYLAVKLNALQASPLSPLFAACVFGLEDLIAKFGREIDGLNKLNHHGQTALCLAIENGKLDVVKSLLSRRFPADPNLLNVRAVQQLEDWDNEPHEVTLYASAMQCAAANGHVEIAKHLIQQGAHIDLVAGYYGSPLQAAALGGHAEMVELLLTKGAEPNSQGGYYGNALQAAAAKGHIAIITLLLENKPPALVNTPGGHYGSALRAAVHSGSSDTVWALLEEKADPNMQVKGHERLLEEAASMGSANRDIVRDLVHAGADADISQRGKGVHIMHRAAMFGMYELVKYCIKHGCQIDMITTQGPPYHRRYNDFPDEMTPLGYACAEGHANIVELLLDNKAPFEEDRPYSAVLWTAAYQGHADVVDLLLRRFKDTHKPEQTAKFLLQRPHPKAGHPIVFAGATSGKADVVEALISHGAKYEANWYGATPLLATATFGCPEVTKVFLDYHCNQTLDIGIDQRARNGRTALFEACSQRRPKIAKMLLDAGANYRIAENDNTTPLQVACHRGMIMVVSAIIEKASQQLEKSEFLGYLNTKHRPTGNVALMDCAEQDRPSCLELLLRHGASYTIPGNGNYTILHLASRPETSIIMSTLIERAVHDLNEQQFLDFVNTRHTTGRTALIDCAERGRLDAVTILLDHAADYSIAGHAGNNPLHWACMGGHDEVVKILLQKAKADASESFPLSQFLDCSNNERMTPLMLAACKDHLSAVKVLLKYGADYAISRDKGYTGVTALHDACFNGSREVATHLLDVASQELDQERLGAFLNATQRDGKTALFEAANTGRPLITKLLLSKYKADYTIVNNAKCTALHGASFNGHPPAVSALLEHASQMTSREQFLAFVNYRNGVGKTALMDACQTGRPEVVRLLLTYGADCTLLDKDEFTALHYCAFRNRIHCVRILLEHGNRDEPNRFRKFLNQQSRTNRASALRDAVLAGHNDVAKLILQYNPVYDGLDSGHRNPLHQALGTGNQHLAVKILEYARKDDDKGRFERFVKEKDEHGDTPWNGSNRRKMGQVVDILKGTGLFKA